MPKNSAKIALPLVGAIALALVALLLNTIGRSGPSAAAGPAIAGPVTSTPTLQMRTVLLSKEDADTEQGLAGWELIAYRGAGCQGHPVNDAFTGEQPVALQLGAGPYSFLETMQNGWTNVTPICQDIDLTSADGELVFRNRREATPVGDHPDLIIESISDAQQPFDCVRPAGVKVVVHNAGTGAAIPSSTRVSVGASSELLPTSALAAGASETLYSIVTGIPLGDTYKAVADDGDVVVEADETNNSLSKYVALATLPTCTSTPLVTGTPTPTPPMTHVQLSKEDADTGERLAGWELIAYRGAGCQGHPVNDAFTGTEPVTLELVAGPYSFLETMQPGWTNVTPLCQDIDLTSADGSLVFRNRRVFPPGDANCDMTVNSIDALLVLQRGAHLLDELACEQQADVNHDSIADARDALLILQHVAGLINLS